MKLKSIHLQNYRAHKDLTVKFDAPFTVVAGVNGSGKTSLLEGIAEVLPCFSVGAQYTETPSFPLDSFKGINFVHLRTDETNGRFRFERQYPVQIAADSELYGMEMEWEAVKYDGVTKAQYTNNIRGDIVQETMQPLFAFYRARRSWQADDQIINETRAAQEKPSRLNGYENWKNAETSVASLQNWIIAKCLERYQWCSETGSLFNEITNDELALVNLALRQAVENIGGLRYDLYQKCMLVEWGSAAPVSFDNLSDGERVVICLVADIARRICLLNPQLGERATVETPGVVLIDELDVHLHPKWQRLIVKGLKAAFPALQFIAASHSPQILGELLPEEIVLLRPGGQDTRHPRVSYGLDSGQVLKAIMDAPARNEDVEKKVEQLFTHIEAGELDVAEAALGELKRDAPQIPELAGAEALILRKKVLGR